MAELKALRKLGWTRAARVVRYDWPYGGPAPSVLDYHDPRKATATPIGVDVYLTGS